VRTLLARALPGLAVLAAAAACDPAINVWGSYFPGWVACLFGGLVATAGLRVVFARTGLERHLGPLFLIYPCLLLLATLLFWIVCFQS
jgi:protein AaeX